MEKITRTLHPPLSVSHPEVAKLWHPAKNGSHTPDAVTCVATFRAWWVCPVDKSHDYQRQVMQQVKGGGCPHCRLKSRSLAALRPDVAKAWHGSLNGDLTPEQVTPGSTIKVWWQCEKNSEHAHEAAIYSKTGKIATGCPFCSKRKTTADTTLAAAKPDIAAQWHPTLNGELLPTQVAWDTNRKVWWLCAENRKHKWNTSVNSRTVVGRGCPYCSGYLITDANRLSVLCPDIAAEWHPTKNRFLRPRVEGSFEVAANRRLPKEEQGRNRRLRPSDVAYTSNESVWWQCKQNATHVWQARIHSRTLNGAGCPFCDGKRIAADNNLAATHPAVAKLWHPSRNGALTPADVAPFSTKRAWFRCPKVATHVWEAVISSVVVARLERRTTGCPYCSGLRVGEGKSLKDQYPEAVEFWDYKRNGDLLPEQLMPQSSKSVWFVCPKSKLHRWECRVAVFIQSLKRGRGCPFCTGKRVALDNCLKTKFPAAARLWHPLRNPELCPTDVTPGSNKSVWWLCMKAPRHEWQEPVNAVTSSLKHGGTGCPFCDKRWASPDYSLWDTYPELGALWDAKRNLPTKPWEVTPGMRRTAWWRCRKDKNHVWEAKIHNMLNNHRRGAILCPFCRDAGK